MSVDPWAQLTRLAARQHGVFTRTQAARSGLDSRRIKTALLEGRIVAFNEQVLGLAGFPASARRAARAATFLSPLAVASHRTAAVLLGFDGVTSAATDLLAPRGQATGSRSQRP